MTTDPNHSKREARRAAKAQLDDDTFTITNPDGTLFTASSAFDLLKKKSAEPEKEKSGFGDRMNGGGFRIIKAGTEPVASEN